MPSKYKKRNTDYLRQPKSGKKAEPTGTDADLNLSSMLPLFTDEAQAREFIESKRWPDGNAYCPHCGQGDAYRLKAKAGSKRPVRPGVWKCRGCRKQFTVRVGTIFEDSKIALAKWLLGIHMMCTSKKGVSSHQLSRQLGITQKSAWFMAMRIREAMKAEPMAGLLAGPVEVDETYVGGKPRVKGKSKRGRGHYGTFHQLSKKHLHRYCHEFGFRWDTRKDADGTRLGKLLEQTEGKRLYYRQPIES